MDKDKLKELGLTDNEVDIYITLLQIGESPVIAIADESGIFKQAVYNSLERLEQKGFVQNTQQKGKKVYKAVNPKRILDYLDAQKDQFETLVPELITLAKAPKEDIETEVHKGTSTVRIVLNDVINTLKEQNGHEVLISGIDERKFLEADKNAMHKQLKKLQEYGFVEKLLSAKGDTLFFEGEQSEYRWIPQRFFSPIPTYVYGDKVAIIIWGNPNQSIIIKNKDVAEAYAKQFYFLWERANLPTITKHGNEEIRALLEKVPHISEVTPDDEKLYNSFIDKEKEEYCYGNNWAYFMQAARRLWYKFYDGETLITVTIKEENSSQFVLVRPLGKHLKKKLSDLAEKLAKLSKKNVIIKKVTAEQVKKLKKVGFQEGIKDPWHTHFVHDDDTFPQQIINLKNIDLKGRRWKDFRHDLAPLLQKHTYDVQDLTPENVDDARAVLNLWAKQKHSEGNESKQHFVRSHEFFIEHFKEKIDNKRYFGIILYMNTIPVGFSLSGKISSTCVGQYANISDRTIKGAAELLLYSALKKMKFAKYKYVNLGGSEERSLYTYKRKFNPDMEWRMHFMVYPISDQS
ncbi:MAG: phosphatidylglycerol lysyltransferase domain-containing protein [Candidatus Woesearchaeota archaeon]|nr:phosphatidylglycerol lysyltransferase domain-containing protein [Candidatus Woesearchaeota archaeon]